MKELPNIEYRGVAIQLTRGKYQADGTRWGEQYTTLEQICEVIDKVLDVPFKRVAVFFEYVPGGDIVRGTATSITQDGEVWVTKTGHKGWGTREKQTGPLFLDTPENAELYKEIGRIRIEWKDVDKTFKARIEAVTDKMAKIGGKPSKVAQ
jgi:phenylpyruvate tautomerase PptA (4-oxalocrotonate tautomerase family)